MTIKIETLDDTIIEGLLITWADANRIARRNCIGLTYLMNVMDLNAPKNTTYAWMKDDSTDTSYLIEL